MFLLGQLCFIVLLTEALPVALAETEKLLGIINFVFGTKFSGSIFIGAVRVTVTYTERVPGFMTTNMYWGS